MGANLSDQFLITLLWKLLPPWLCITTIFESFQWHSKSSLMNLKCIWHFGHDRIPANQISRRKLWLVENSGFDQRGFSSHALLFSLLYTLCTSFLVVIHICTVKCAVCTDSIVTSYVTRLWRLDCEKHNIKLTFNVLHIAVQGKKCARKTHILWNVWNVL